MSLFCCDQIEMIYQCFSLFCSLCLPHGLYFSKWITLILTESVCVYVCMCVCVCVCVCVCGDQESTRLLQEKHAAVYQRQLLVKEPGTCLQLDRPRQTWLVVMEHFIFYLLSFLFPYPQPLPQFELTNLKSSYFNVIELPSTPHWRTHFPLVSVRID